MNKKRKPGRPAGAKNKKTEAVCERPEFRCTRCGSTERTAYTGSPRVVRGKLKGRDGKLYAKAEMRRTRCLSCGLWRFDKTMKEPIKD